MKSILFLFLLSYVILETIYASREEKELIRSLIGKDSDYETLERPILNQSQSLVVKLGIYLQQIVNVDEINQNIMIYLWLNMFWKNDYMIWNPAEHGNISTLSLPPKYLWKPDIILYNSVNENFDTIFPANMVVRHTGDINYLPPSIITATCKIDITWFPFDDQICILKFGSWTYNGFLINLTAGEVDLSTYTTNGEWYLQGVKPIRTEFKYTCCPEPYQDVTFHFHLSRRTLYYGFNLIIPCMLISVMTLLSFILPVDSGEKLGFGITIFMSHIVFLLMIASALPPTSDAVPIIGIYFSTTMVIVSLSQLFSVIVLNFFYRTPVIYTMSPWMRTAFVNFMPWLLMMHRPGYRFYRGRSIKISEEEEAIEMADVKDVWEKDIKNSIWIEQTEQLVNGSLKKDFHSNPLHVVQKEYEKSSDLEMDRNVALLLPEIRELHIELNKITQKMKEGEDDAEVINDWKFISQVIDRMCLWVFSVLLIVATIGIIFSAPRIV